MKTLTSTFNTKTQYSTIFGNKTRLQTCFYRKYCCCKKTEIDAIITNSDVPTFENTIVALDFAGEQLIDYPLFFFNLNSAETNDEMQKIAQEVSPLLTEFSNDIALNEDLFKRVKAVYDQKIR
jgi:peptidyl-dipeptidase Dcp